MMDYFTPFGIVLAPNRSDEITLFIERIIQLKLPIATSKRPWFHGVKSPDRDTENATGRWMDGCGYSLLAVDVD